MDDNEEWSGVAAEATLAKFNAWHGGVRGVLSITRHNVSWAAERHTVGATGARGSDTDSGGDDASANNSSARIPMHSVETAKLARSGTVEIFAHGTIGMPVCFTPLRKDDAKIARKLINKISKDRAANRNGRSAGSTALTHDANATNGNSGSSQPRLKKQRRKLSKRRLSYRNANAVDPALEAAEMANLAKKYTPPVPRRDTDDRRNSNNGEERYERDADSGGGAVERLKAEWRKMVERVYEESRGTAAKWWLTHSLDISVCVVAIFALIVTIATLAMADVLTLRIRLLGVAVSSIAR